MSCVHCKCFLIRMGLHVQFLFSILEVFFLVTKPISIDIQITSEWPIKVCLHDIRGPLVCSCTLFYIIPTKHFLRVINYIVRIITATHFQWTFLLVILKITMAKYLTKQGRSQAFQSTEIYPSIVGSICFHECVGRRELHTLHWVERLIKDIQVFCQVPFFTFYDYGTSVY